MLYANAELRLIGGQVWSYGHRSMRRGREKVKYDGGDAFFPVIQTFFVTVKKMDIGIIKMNRQIQD